MCFEFAVFVCWISSDAVPLWLSLVVAVYTRFSDMSLNQAKEKALCRIGCNILTSMKRKVVISQK